jgi:Tfp pilus assembly protein PilO
MEKLFINQTTFRILYFKYKEFIVPIVATLVCFLIVIYVLVPQFQQYLSLVDQSKQLQSQIDILNQNNQLLTRLDGPLLQSRLKLATRALPSEKDFDSIINAISRSASTSNVSVGDYSLQIGDVATNTNSSLQVNLNLLGNIVYINNFIAQIKKQNPLADVKSLSIASGGTQASLTVEFYSQSLPILRITPTDIFHDLSSSELALLKQISSHDSSSQSQLGLAQ